MKFLTSLLLLFFCSAQAQEFAETGAWGNYTILKPDVPIPGQKFGSAIAMNAEYAAVGAVGFGNFRGHVYVFHREQYNLTDGRLLRGGCARNLKVAADVDEFNQTAILLANDGVTGDQFGTSIAIADLEDGSSIILVGAPYRDVVSDADAGAVYVFKRENGTEDWVQAQKLTLADSDDYNQDFAENFFGYSLGYDNDYLVVGAYQAGPAGSNSAGAAFSYLYNNETGLFEYDSIIIQAPAVKNSASFGYSVSVRNHSVAIGAPDGIDDSGVFIYNRDNTENKTDGVWEFEVQLLPFGFGGPDDAGTQVYLDFTRVVVSSALYDLPNANANSGRANTFDLTVDNTTRSWNESGSFAPEDVSGNDNVGAAMVVQANFLALGAQAHDPIVNSVSRNGGGAVYTYFFNSTLNTTFDPTSLNTSSWQELDKLVPDETVAGDALGAAIGLWCDSLLLGAPGAMSSAGVVYWYKKDAEFENKTACTGFEIVMKPPPPKKCKFFRIFCRVFHKGEYNRDRNPVETRVPVECPDVFDPCVESPSEEL